jgi:hypothetical protein
MRHVVKGKAKPVKTQNWLLWFLACVALNIVLVVVVIFLTLIATGTLPLQYIQLFPIGSGTLQPLGVHPVLFVEAQTTL